MNLKMCFPRRHQGAERGVQAYYRPSHCPTVHGFLGAGELDGPLADVWALLRQPAHSHLYNPAVRSAWTRPLDGSTQLGEPAETPPNHPIRSVQSWIVFVGIFAKLEMKIFNQ